MGNCPNISVLVLDIIMPEVHRLPWVERGAYGPKYILDISLFLSCSLSQLHSSFVISTCP